MISVEAQLKIAILLLQRTGAILSYICQVYKNDDLSAAHELLNDIRKFLEN